MSETESAPADRPTVIISAAVAAPRVTAVRPGAVTATDAVTSTRDPKFLSSLRTRGEEPGEVLVDPGDHVAAWANEGDRLPAIGVGANINAPVVAFDRAEAEPDFGICGWAGLDENSVSDDPGAKVVVAEDVQQTLNAGGMIGKGRWGLLTSGLRHRAAPGRLRQAARRGR